MPRPKKPESERRSPTYLKMEPELKAWIQEQARAAGRKFSQQLHRMLWQSRKRIEAGTGEGE